MINIDFSSQLATQTQLKARSISVVDAIEAERETFFGYDSILDMNRDKISGWELDRKLEKIRNCGTLLEWRVYGEQWELHNANFCRQPDGCPICAKRLQKNRVRRFKDPIIEASKFFPHAYFVTFTVKNRADLRTALQELTEGLKRFRRQGQRRGAGHSFGEWSKVRAGMISIEIKRGADSSLWHPHAHGLIFTDSQIDYKADKSIPFNGSMVKASKLSSDWYNATKGQSINIDCRPIFKRKVEREGRKIWLNVWDQSLEILKYNSKIIDGSGNVNAVDLATILCAGYARRKFNTYGEFRDRESKFYCGPLEPYVIEPPEGFKGLPLIYSQRWWQDRYGEPYLERGPIIEEFKRNEWRTLAAGIQGEYKRRKYRILGVRRWFQRRRKMKEFEKALEENEKRKLAALRQAREDYHETPMTENMIKALLSKAWSKYSKLLTQQQFLESWYRGIPDGQLPPAALERV